MAVLSKDDFINRVKALAGDNADDETLSMIEDFTDTYNDLETRTNDTEDWKSKFEQNDAEWRNKYKERFFSGDSTNPKDVKDVQKEDVIDDSDEDITFDDLFEEREG